MPRKQTYKEPNAKNSLCRALGHDWMTTAAANYRVCQRDGCRACQHLQDGQWTSNAAWYRKHVPVETDGTRPYLRRQARQRSLWSEPSEGGQP